MPEDYQEIGQNAFLTDYEDFAISPPVKYNYDQLPFSDLPPRRFEQFCLKYCYKTYGMERCTLYGYPGQKQYGLDILVADEPDQYILYQCKKVNDFSGADLIDAIKVFQNEKHQHKWYAKTSEFVLFSSNELIDTSFIEELERQRKTLHAGGIILTKLGSTEISELIKNDVEIVYEFFGELWVKGFIKPEIYQPYFANLTKLPEKKLYGEVRDYIPRILTNPEKAKESLGYTFYDAQQLNTYLTERHAENKPGRVIIRSDAGLGKSKELDHLAHIYSKAGKLFPVVIRLKLYQGDLEKLVGAFYEPWKQVPKPRLLLLFDGLDEVSNNYLESFLEQFNLFLQEYASANIITTARSSFSLKSIGDGVDENSVLKPQYLKPLEQQEIQKYLSDRRLTLIQIKQFNDFCSDRRLTDLLNNPFYLKNLVDIFQHPSLNFPNDRADAIAQIIKLKLEQDQIKFPVMPSVDIYLRFGKKLAVYLTLTGRNSLMEDQITGLTALTATQIRYCSLFSCEENDKVISVYFEHNNFQEYLTASHLNGLDWPGLQKLLFHEPSFLILKPRLVNTANYLFTLMVKDSTNFQMFFNTLKEHNPELLLRFEKDKINLNIRLDIFRHLILVGKKEGLYYLRGKFEVEDLLAFIQHTPEILSFLFTQLGDVASSPIHKKCLLEILLNFHTGNITGSNRRLLHNTLKQIIQSQQTPAVHDMAIDVMTRHLFVDAADIRLCIKKCPNEGIKLVREAILKMIKVGGGQYFDYILKSAPLLFPQDNNSSSELGNEFLEVVLGLIDAKTAVTWLKFAVSNVDLLGIVIDTMYDPSERLTIQKINLKLAELYLQSKDHGILNGYMVFVSAIHANLSESKWGNLALFFINTNTVENAFFALLKEEDTVLYRSSIGADLASKEIINLLVERVTAGEVPKDSLRLTRNFLHYFNRFELFNYIDGQINAQIPDFFPPVTESAANWHELNEQRTSRDFEILKSKSIFLAEAEMIFNEVARLNDFGDDWFMLEYSEKAEIKNIVTNNLIFQIIERGKIAGYAGFVAWIDEWKWDYFVFTQLTVYAINQKKKIPEDWAQWLQAYVSNVLLKEVDFKKSLKRIPDGGYTATYGSKHIRSLFVEGFIDLPQTVLFDMISFDTSGFTQLTPSPVKREYLFQKIIEKVDDIGAFKQRVLLNLTKKIAAPRVLETHCSICIYLQITEAIPLLIDQLHKKSTTADIKDSIITTLIKLGADPGILVNELKGIRFITESWHWELFKPVHNEILNGNMIWDKSACLALAERSALKHAIESRLKWRLIKAALKLGSLKSANQFFKFLGTNRSWSDYADIDAKDFEGIEAIDPKKLIVKCVNILESSVLSIIQERPNMVERFVTQLIRQLAVKNYETMLFALQRYESLIVKLIAQKPDLVHLRWYEKDLVTDYYIQTATFEDEQIVLQMVNAIN